MSPKVKGKAKTTKSMVAHSSSSAIVAKVDTGNKAGKSWRLCGEGGTSISTAANKKGAKAFLNQFVHLKNFGFQLGGDDKDSVAAAQPYEDVLCQLLLLQEFGSFLCEEAKTKRKNELLMALTVKQMFSCAITVLKFYYKGNALWNNQKDWFSKIVLDAVATTGRRRMAAGLPIQDKSEGIGRTVLEKIVQECLKVDAKNQVQGIKDRIALVTNFLAIGRSGEVGLSSYALSYWCNIYECFCLWWGEQKRVKQVPLNFFVDMECLELDFNHADRNR